MYFGHAKHQLNVNKMNIKQSYTGLILLFVLASFFQGFAQQTKEEKKQQEYAQIQNLINSKNYVFVAQTVLPLGGRTRNLTSTYDLKVSGDTVISDLPYFGRAFAAPIDPTEGGIRFTSTDFNYNVNERKKGGWDIEILPKDAKDVRQMLLNVTESGYGSLQVISNNRQQISYNGYIKERKGKS
jgi:hypothetical protein